MSACGPVTDYFTSKIENEFFNSKEINEIKQTSLILKKSTAEDFKGEKGLNLIELILNDGVEDTQLRSQLRVLMYEIVKDDELLDFFINISPPETTGYAFWICPEMTKVHSLFTSDTETLFSFAFKCRMLKRFFSNI